MSEAVIQSPIDWAQQMCRQPGTIVIDTETTGTNSSAEIVDIGVVSIEGEILLDTLVRPMRPIPPGATAVHGISDEDVATAPFWPEVYIELVQLFAAAGPVVIYNVDFDVRIMNQDNGQYNLPRFEADWQCAMLQYATYKGQWNHRHGNYRWHKLTDAIQSFGMTVPADAHRALTDAVLTAKLVRAMAERSGPHE